MAKENNIKEFIRLIIVINGLGHYASSYRLDKVLYDIEQKIINEKGKPVLDLLVKFILEKQNDKEKPIAYNDEDKLDNIVSEFERYIHEKEEEAKRSSNEATDDNPKTITIKGKEYSTDLEMLDLTDRKLTDADIEPLRHMTNLMDLTIMSFLYGGISDLTPLSGLNNLTNLVIFGKKVSDLTPLSGLNNLKTLVISDNEVSDLSPLSGLSNLTDLMLYEPGVEDLSPLSNLTNLTQLYLSAGKFNDISPLSKLTNLTKLELGGKQIEDFSPLYDLSNLRELELDKCYRTQKEELKKALPKCKIILSDEKIIDDFVLTPKIHQALIYAIKAHNGQVDKSGEPYLLHPLQVAYTLKDEDERIVALLHDVVEDTNYTIEDIKAWGFEQVADAIDCLTRRKEETYAKFINRVGTNKLATKVKIADMKHNLSRIDSLPEEERGLADRYNKWLPVLENKLLE